MRCIHEKRIREILANTAYARRGGTEAEHACAAYLQSLCVQMGLDAKLDPFPVTVITKEESALCVDGAEIPCTGYLGLPAGEVRGALYYLPDALPSALKRCRNKIVLTDKAVGYRLYDQLCENGARGFITYGGRAKDTGEVLDTREVRYSIEEETALRGVHVHIRDAARLSLCDGADAHITLSQTRVTADSYNVIAELAGECDEWVTVTAHYDSTARSTGAYDNMSSCIVMLALAEHFSRVPHRASFRFIFCGSEERGLLGSLAYCRAHEEELKKTLLNVNLDMLGSVLGGFVSLSCADDEMERFLGCFARQHRFPSAVRSGIRSSDSNSFLLHGVPSVSFARYAPQDWVQIHTEDDVAATVSPKRLMAEARYIAAFLEAVGNDTERLRALQISEKIRGEINAYFQRKI